MPLLHGAAQGCFPLQVARPWLGTWRLTRVGMETVLSAPREGCVLTSEPRLDSSCTQRFPRQDQWGFGRLMPTMPSSRLPQGPTQSNTEDICCVVRPPSCEQAQSFALFPFSSSLSSYQAFSTCCFHHLSYCREFFPCVAVCNSSQSDSGLFAY